MRVLIVSIELKLPGCRSLKGRRSIIDPLKQRLRTRLNLSVSEVSPGDQPDRSRLGIAAVIDSRGSGDRQLSHIRSMIESEPRLLVLEEETDYW